MIAAFDLDGTLILENSSFNFCLHLAKNGKITKRQLIYCVRCYLSFKFLNLSLAQLHSKVFNKIFQNREVSELESYLPSFISSQKWYLPAVNRLDRLKSEGAKIAIFSSSPTFIVKPITAHLLPHIVIATEYQVSKQNRLEKLRLCIDGAKKAEFLEAIAGKEQTLAFSDSIHDLPFLKRSDRAIAVKPDKSLKKIAKNNGWEIL